MMNFSKMSGSSLSKSNKKAFSPFSCKASYTDFPLSKEISLSSDQPSYKIAIFLSWILITSQYIQISLSRVMLYLVIIFFRINNINSSTFDNKNIGIAKAVTVNSISIVDGNNGGLASNYSISSGQTTTADVSVKQLTVSGILASSKSYDGTTSTTLDTSSVNYSGLVSGDDLTGSFSGVFVNDNIGTGRVINITSSYSGDDI